MRKLKDPTANVPQARTALPLMAAAILRADKTLRMEGSNFILDQDERVFLLAYVASFNMTDEDFMGYPETTVDGS